MAAVADADDPIVVLIPVFNDWQATELLLRQLDREMQRSDRQVHVLLVDDASTEPPAPHFLQEYFPSFARIEILELRRNLGHQRAIAVGLAYLQANEPCQAVVVMDGDGEDDPRDVPRLIARYEQEGRRAAVFAQRVERSESWLFRFFYVLYRCLYKLLTGRGINVGNFSILPWEALNRLVAVTELWTHYAAAVYKARLPVATIPTRRSTRLAGRSRMNFVALVMHGLSAIAIFGDVVGVRLLLANMAVVAMTLLGLGAVVVVRLTTDLAVPGWATYAVGVILVLLFQAVLISFVFIFIILHSRQIANFLPVRDYSHFVLRTRSILWKQEPLIRIWATSSRLSPEPSGGRVTSAP
jgi:hypothetical protein